MRRLTRKLIVLAIITVGWLASCSGKPAGDFTPLIRPGPAGQYDLTLENIPNIRAAELAPGAEPAKPVIDGKKATRKAHFITTYDGEVTAKEIGVQIEKGFMDALFFTTYSYRGHDSDGGYEIQMEYTFPGGTGTLKVVLKEVDSPNQLDFRYTATEELE